MKEQPINIIIEGEIDLGSQEDLFFTELLNRILKLRQKKIDTDEPPVD